MTAEEFQEKFELSQLAASCYNESGKLTMRELIDASGKTASEIYTLFPNKRSIIRFYYDTLIFRYRVMIDDIDDFETYTLGEKLSNFIYTTFDMLNEHRNFVEATFQKTVLCTSTKTDFAKETEELFHEFAENDPRISMSSALLPNDLLFCFLRSQYFSLIRFWLKDDSDEKERTIALTDKLTSFFEEVMYSAIIDKGFDLTKYVLSTSSFGRNFLDLGEEIFSWFSHKKESAQGASKDE